MDADIDSAGLTFLLRCQNRFSGDFHTEKVVRDVVPDYSATPKNKSLEDHALFGNLACAGDKFGLPNNHVLFLGANPKGGEGNKKKQENYEFFDDMLEVFEKYGCAAVIFDTPAGTQALANKSILASDTVVVCMRPTYQFRMGSADYLRRVKSRTRNTKYILCPTAVPIERSTFFGEHFPDCVERLIREDIAIDVEREWKDTKNKLEMGMLKESPEHLKKETLKTYEKDRNNYSLIGIPEVERFKWMEGCLAKEEHLECDSGMIPKLDEKMAIERYKLLSELICQQSM